MNKKDVLGARLLRGSSQKMKSPPHGLSAGNAQNTALNRAGTAGSFGCIWYLIPCQNKSQPGIEFANQLHFRCVRYQNDIKCCTRNIK